MDSLFKANSALKLSHLLAVYIIDTQKNNWAPIKYTTNVTTLDKCNNFSALLALKLILHANALLNVNKMSTYAFKIDHFALSGKQTKNIHQVLSRMKIPLC